MAETDRVMASIQQLAHEEHELRAREGSCWPGRSGSRSRALTSKELRTQPVLAAKTVAWTTAAIAFVVVASRRRSQLPEASAEPARV
jgi:hypothetical protein